MSFIRCYWYRQRDPRVSFDYVDGCIVIPIPVFKYSPKKTHVVCGYSVIDAYGTGRLTRISYSGNIIVTEKSHIYLKPDHDITAKLQDIFIDIEWRCDTYATINMTHRLITDEYSYSISQRGDNNFIIHIKHPSYMCIYYCISDSTLQAIKEIFNADSVVVDDERLPGKLSIHKNPYKACSRSLDDFVDIYIINSNIKRDEIPSDFKFNITWLLVR